MFRTFLHLSLGVCAGILVQEVGGAAQRQAATGSQLDIMVSAGGKPAPNAAVMAAEESLQNVVVARTDPQGRAQLSVPPGRYRVSAALDGHHMQVTVARAANGSTVNIRFALTAKDPFALVSPGSGVVSGRVLDANGEPVPYASVDLYDGFNPGGSGRTEADGTFRFTARAHPSPNSAYNKVTVSQAAHVWSDVPAVVSLANRTELSHSVQVRERQETTLELRVPTSPHYRVTVVLRDELGGVLFNPTIMLYGRNRFSAPGVKADQAVFGPLPPGPVTVVAAADGRNGLRLAGIAELTIVDRPLDDVVLTLAPAARIRGRVEFQDRDPESPPGATIQVLTMIPGRQRPPIHSNDPNGRVAPDGSFVIEGLVGTRCLWMWNVPRGWQLAAILRDGRDITDEPIAFSAGEQVDDVVVRFTHGAERLGRPTCDPR